MSNTLNACLKQHRVTCCRTIVDCWVSLHRSIIATYHYTRTIDPKRRYLTGNETQQLTIFLQIYYRRLPSVTENNKLCFCNVVSKHFVFIFWWLQGGRKASFAFSAFKSEPKICLTLLLLCQSTSLLKLAETHTLSLPPSLSLSLSLSSFPLTFCWSDSVWALCLTRRIWE